MIDYNHLAEIAERTVWTFERLVVMAEKGEPLPRISDDTWMDLDEAADALGLVADGVRNQLNKSRVRWQSVSPLDPSNRQGIGCLYLREDIALLVNVKKEARLSLPAAVRVFDWIRRSSNL